MDEFLTQTQQLNIELSNEKNEQFKKYTIELLKWNEQTNLTAIRDERGVATKHFVDSLTVLQALPKHIKNLIDIGSGAGFPGIPIKIARPELEVTLVEATHKKVEFLSHIIRTLDLQGIRVITGRAEDLGHTPEFREQFDAASARAVAELSVLSELVLPFVRVGGVFIAQKILLALNDPEITEAHNAVQILGGRISHISPISIHDLNDRSLVLIEKISQTPSKFPRRSGIPSKRPLKNI